MRALRTALARLRALWRRDAIADEIADELQFHLEMRTRELEDRGVPSREARRRAARRFGNMAALKDQGYDIRGGGLLETVLTDVRHAWYLIRRRRIYSTAAILTLALGIGLSTTLISILDAAWLRPLPFPDAERLVAVHLTVQEGGGERPSTPAPADVRALRTAGHVLDGIGQWRSWEERLVLDTGELERVKVLTMSEGYADVYGVPPTLGRTFVLDDARQGAAPVAVLGHAFWRRRFAADPGILGQTVLLANVSTTIVGVLPSALHRDTHIWLPDVGAMHTQHRDSGAEVYARVRRGVTLAEAERALGAIARDWPTARDAPRVSGVSLKPLYVDAVASTRNAVSMIVMSVLVLIALICVNVAGLIFADGTERRREFAVRASLGAGRGRLVRQMITEAAVLGATASILGVFLSWWSLDALVSILPLELPPHAAPALNARVLGLSMAAAMTTVVVVTLWPARRVAAASLTENMSGAARHFGTGWPRAFGRGLIVAEVALAVVLLTGGGLLIRSLDRLLSVDLGFQPDAFVTMEAVPLDQSPAVWQRYFPQLLERLRAVPGVASAGAIDGMPLGGGAYMVMGVDERPEAEPDPLEGVVVSGVSPGYLEAIGVRLLEGRLFTEEDRGRNVVVLDETAARRVSRNGTAVGLTVDALSPSTVIGVVSAIRQSPSHDGGPRVYSWLVPHAMLPPFVVIRAEPGVALSYANLRLAALSVGTRAVVERIRPGTELLDDTVAKPRNRALLLGLLAGLGLLLTLIGTAGVTAYAVARRTQEVGVRMAFGATPRDVVAGLTFEALRPIATGVGAGLVASYFATSVLQSFLFQTPAQDPLTFAAVGALLTVTTLIAAWLPARRAASIDPVQALRTE